MKRPGRHSQVGPLSTANVRVIAGFLFAPIVGFFLYYALSFILVFHEFSFSHALSVGIAAIFVGGRIFYTPAVLIAVIVMLLMRRFYQWNLISSVVGSMIIVLLLVLGFAVGLWILSSEFSLAQVGFFRSLQIFFGPSVLSGVVFWLLAVHRNVDLHHRVET